VTGARTTLTLLLAAFPLAAWAQTAFTLAALSDFRARGLSYSEKKPVLQGAVSHDFASGAYAGAFVSRASVRSSRVSSVGSLYLGLAREADGFHWDAGVVQNVYGNGRQYRYHEWYAGIGVERLSARLSYSPDYQGMGGRTAYIDISGSYPLGEHVEASAHAGYLKPLDSNTGWYYRQMARADWRIGLNAFTDDWSFQLAWSGTRKAAGVFPGWRYGETRGLVLGATRHF
jgi:uncharacterized protein (TIGR02001 family)